jgi:putative transposase
VLGALRSNLHDRLSGRTKPRRRYPEAQDAAVLPLITTLVAARPTCGYRRITAIPNRQRRAQGLAPVNHKRVHQIMQANNLLLARRYTARSAHTHNGRVVVMRSHVRWCSDGFEFARLGMAPSSAAPSSSTRTTARLSPGARW